MLYFEIYLVSPWETSNNFRYLTETVNSWFDSDVLFYLLIFEVLKACTQKSLFQIKKKKKKFNNTLDLENS